MYNSCSIFTPMGIKKITPLFDDVNVGVDYEFALEIVSKGEFNEILIPPDIKEFDNYEEILKRIKENFEESLITIDIATAEQSYLSHLFNNLKDENHSVGLLLKSFRLLEDNMIETVKKNIHFIENDLGINIDEDAPLNYLFDIKHSNDFNTFLKREKEIINKTADFLVRDFTREDVNYVSSISSEERENVKNNIIKMSEFYGHEDIKMENIKRRLVGLQGLREDGFLYLNKEIYGSLDVGYFLNKRDNELLYIKHIYKKLFE